MENDKVLTWFNAIEASLRNEAKVAGLFRNSSSIGNAREFMVDRALRTFLPASVEIGTGEIVDTNGRQSKQIDIVVYDPRFPALRTGAGSLYFVEGVLATIEVKSSLTRRHLKQALENCRSVAELENKYIDLAECDAAVARLKTKSGSDTQAHLEFDQISKPATYIYAFTSSLSLQTLGGYLRDWTTELGGLAHSRFPDVITAGNHIFMRPSGPLKLHGSQAEPISTGFSSRHSFRYFATHMFARASERLGLRNGWTHTDYAIRSYLDSQKFVPEKRDGFHIQYTSG